MISILRRHISLKISDVLKQLSIVKDNDLNFNNKLDYFVKIKKADKSSKENEFADFEVKLNNTQNKFSLTNCYAIQLNKVDKNRLIEIQNLKDDLIESVSLDTSFKLTVKVNTNKFKEFTLKTIFNQNSSYGFHLDDCEIYPKLIDDGTIEWHKKKSKTNTIVEFSSPNIAKPLHAGHMRSTFLGNFLSNLHQELGQNVTRINYLGDWGTQYGFLAVGFQKYGSYDKLNESPIKHLLEVYVQANNDESLRADALKYFAEMEAQNQENIKTWKLFKDLSIKELNAVYKKLNINFDVYESESQYYLAGKEWVKKLLERNIATKLENNAVQVNLSPISKSKKKSSPLSFIVQKADGSTLYITRDIAALFERKEKYDFSKIVYVVDSSQRDHFVRLYQTVKTLDQKILKNISFDEFYVPFGRILNMSTRKGKVEFLSELTEEAKSVAFESMMFSKNQREVEDPDHVAQVIGNSHLIISDFAKQRLKDYEFSWSKIVSKDDSAYMCHYAHARLTTLLENAKATLNIEPTINGIQYEKLSKTSELNLIQHLARFDEAVWESYQQYEPYHIVFYLFQLVHLTNICFHENFVIGEEESLAKARLLLYHSSRQVIQNAFRVLGITSLNKI